MLSVSRQSVAGEAGTAALFGGARPHPACLIVVGRDGRVLDLDPAGAALLGQLSPGAGRGAAAYERVAVADLPRVLAAHQAAFTGDGPSQVAEYAVTAADGEVRTLITSWIPVPAAADAERTVLLVSHDVSGQPKLAADLHEPRALMQTLAAANRANLRSSAAAGEAAGARPAPAAVAPGNALPIDSEAFSRRMIEASADIIQLLDDDGRLVFTNARGLEVLGLDSGDAIAGVRWASLWPLGARDSVDFAIEQARTLGCGEFTAKGMGHGASDRWWSVVVTPIHDAAGATTGLMALSRDITLHKLAEQRTDWLATHDALTELPNRRLLQPSVERALAEAATRGEKLALVLFDLDRFKEVNDELGHDAGDAVLLAIAARLHQLPAPVTLAARLGGDEFALLLTGFSDEAAIFAVVDMLTRRLHDPIEWHGRTLASRGSFGIALYPDHGDGYSELLRRADTALYDAKRLGRGRYSLYAPCMQRAAEHKAAMARRVRASLNGDLVAHYQPKIGLLDGRVAGFEALLRIKGPRGRMEGPPAIAPALEDAELSRLVSDHMIEQVTGDLRRWLDAGLDVGRIAINAGGLELRRGRFAERLLSRLAGADIPPQLIEVEVAEGLFSTTDTGGLDRVLHELAAAGVGIAIDDFGMSHASLSHLRRCPVGTIKIDASLTGGIGAGGPDAAIVRALLALGRSLDIAVVAEGVETLEQAAFLAAEGCALGQGFLLGRAVPAAQVPGLLAKPRRLPWRGWPSSGRAPLAATR
jgi:diguanylate cyclase (GGDEF)-like protein/PAS domain S-box-containing protein